MGNALVSLASHLAATPSLNTNASITATHKMASTGLAAIAFAMQAGTISTFASVMFATVTQNALVVTASIPIAQI